jgi:hypothetical protein
MSNIVRFALPLLLVVVAFTQWLLVRAKRSLTIEDKARLTDATFRPWWIMLVFAAILLVWSFGFESVPRQWHWWSLVAFVVVVFVFSVVSAAIQWRSLVRSGVARNYVRTQLWVFVVLYCGMLVFLQLCFMMLASLLITSLAHLSNR